MPELLSLPEACRLHRLAYITAWSAIAAGKLDAQRVGKRWYVSPRAVEKYLATVRANGRKVATSAA